MATQYATRTELEQYALVAAAFSGVSDADVDAALLAASSEADTYLAARYDSLPLTEWPPALTLNVCKLAAWNLMCTLGFNPNDSSHVALQINHDAAVKWFGMLAAGRVSLGITETSPASGTTPTVYSDDSRGF